MHERTNHKVVIVGGGAGGLELACWLGHRYGPGHITLVDKSPFHIWKPTLHEVAAGTLDIRREGLSYAMLARDCGFTFVPGELQGLERVGQVLELGPLISERGEVFGSSRTLRYDSLVLAVGSKSNFFGTPGAAEYSITLDSATEAERFRLRLLHALHAVNAAKREGENKQLNVVIVGGGATGVELAAELHEACAHIAVYGLTALNPVSDIHIVLMEGALRILPLLPEKLASAADARLAVFGIEVRTNVRVARIASDGVSDSEDNFFPADICVWAAGIEAPRLLKTFGLATNRVNQIVVDAFLCSEDPNVFALGDCAQAPWVAESKAVPARAQAAHQQANYLGKALARRIRELPRESRPFEYRDRGSLVSLGRAQGVGALMGMLSGKGLFVEGQLARMMYASLHLMHHQAVVGTLGRLLLRRTAPRVKLH